MVKQTTSYKNSVTIKGLSIIIKNGVPILIDNHFQTDFHTQNLAQHTRLVTHQQIKSDFGKNSKIPKWQTEIFNSGDRYD